MWLWVRSESFPDSACLNPWLLSRLWNAKSIDRCWTEISFTLLSVGDPLLRMTDANLESYTRLSSNSYLGKLLGRWLLLYSQDTKVFIGVLAFSMCSLTAFLHDVGHPPYSYTFWTMIFWYDDDRNDIVAISADERNKINFIV